MPLVALPLVAAVAQAAVTSALTTTLFSVALTKALIGAVISIGLSFVASALAPKPPTRQNESVPNVSPTTAAQKSAVGAASFQARATQRVQQFRQPITAWRFIYGETRVSGPLTFVTVTGNKQFLHMVITLASHAIEAFKVVFLNDEAIVVAGNLHVDANGLVNTGKYSGKVRIQTDTGATTGQPFPDLVTEATEWTSAHKQQGRAKIYVRMEFDQDVFPSSIPNISAWVKGKKLATASGGTAAWSFNPSLILRDYLTTARIEGGMGVTTAEVDSAFTLSAANSSEEIVSTARQTATITSVNTSANLVTVSGVIATLQCGDRVRLETTNTLPAGLATATDYYVKSWTPQGVVQYAFASTFAQCVTDSGANVNITGSGTGTHTIVKTGEPRYTGHGMVTLDSSPNAAVEEILSAMAGRLVYASGVWRIQAGVYNSPTFSFDEGDTIQPIQATTKAGRRERFNAVKGVYVSLINHDQPTDFPPITNATYEAEDNGERTFRELDLPFTTRPHTAQRIAKLELERHRQMVTANVVLNLKGLQVQAGDTIQYSNTRLRWTNKVFEVVDWSLSAEGEDAPILGVGLTLRETASTVFDWNSGLETTVDLAPNTNLPDPFTVKPPQNLTVTESIYSTRGSAGVKARATVSWSAADDPFVRFYQMEYRLNSSGDNWTVTARTEGLVQRIDDIAPGTYDFRVRATNSLNVRSTYLTLTKEVFGLLTPPATPTNISISAVGGLAIIRWDLVPDLDVQTGGKIVFRHSKELTGASWGASVGIGQSVPGKDTIALLPLKEGTYLLKSVDSSGIESTNTGSVSTKQAVLHAFTAVSTITENATFVGSTTNVVVDTGTSPPLIKLSGSALVDSIADVDAVANWDAVGGVVATGTYVFSSAFDFGSVVNRRLTTTIAATVINENDLMDSRTALLDDWDTFDGDVSGAADARVYARESDDLSTWGSWMLLDSAEFTARGVQMKCVLTTTDPAFNIHVTQLSVAADRIT